MKNYLFGLTILTCLVTLVVARSLAATTDTNPPEPNAPAASATDAAGPNTPAGTTADPDKTSIAVTVNGVDITEAAVDAEVAQQLRRVKIPAQMRPAIIEQVKKELRQPAIENLIANVLVDEETRKAKIVVTEEEVIERVREFVSRQRLSLDDFKVLLQAQGKSFDQWKKQMPFHKGVAYRKLLEAQFAGKINITEDDAKKFYSENPEQFETPEQFRLSHIFIKPDAAALNADPNQAMAKAKAKAENVLKQIKDGTDFAELARANSDDRLSAACGGDLVNFFDKNSNVPPAFREAAFKLKVGQVSDLVETRSGYHIIKATAHKDAGVISFEQAKDSIISKLTRQKKQELARQYIESLKAKADIVYRDPVLQKNRKTGTTPPRKEPKPAEPGRDANAAPPK